MRWFVLKKLLVVCKVVLYDSSKSEELVNESLVYDLEKSRDCPQTVPRPPLDNTPTASNGS